MSYQQLNNSGNNSQSINSKDELINNSVFYKTYQIKRTKDNDDHDSDMDDYDYHKHSLSSSALPTISPPIYKGPSAPQIDDLHSAYLDTMEYELYQKKQQQQQDELNNNNKENSSNSNSNSNSTLTPNTLISKLKQSRISNSGSNNTNNSNKKIIISKNEMNKRIRRYLLEQYNSGSSNNSNNNSNIEQLLSQYTTQEEIDEETHKRNSLFHRLPDIMEGYLQLVVRLVLVGFFIFILFFIFSSILYDVNIKYKEYSLEIMKEVEKCSKQYNENKCNPITRIPAMETTCIQWELCMEKNANSLPKSKILAGILSEVLDSFILNMSYKTIAFLITVIWMMIWIPNRLFDRQKVQHSSQLHHNQIHQQQHQQQQHTITNSSSSSAPTHSIFAKNLFTLDPNHVPKLEQILKD